MLGASNDRQAEVSKIFSVVQERLLKSDKYVQEAATLGFLEDIQNTDLHEDAGPHDFLRFCGPEALFWWEKVARFWSHGELIAESRRSEYFDKQ